MQGQGQELRLQGQGQGLDMQGQEQGLDSQGQEQPSSAQCEKNVINATDVVAGQQKMWLKSLDTSCWKWSEFARTVRESSFESAEFSNCNGPLNKQ